jgi:hypothetical protein
MPRRKQLEVNTMTAPTETISVSTSDLVLSVTYVSAGHTQWASWQQLWDILLAWGSSGPAASGAGAEPARGERSE